MPARLPALLAAPPAGATALRLTNARLIDGTGGAPRSDASVHVRDGRIEAVGSAADGGPDDAVTIDLAGRTLMPGLVDAHAHVLAKLHPLAAGAGRSCPARPRTSSPPTSPRRCGAASRRSATSAPTAASWSRRGRRCGSGPSAARGC